jgi:adenylosuccinate synthase
MALGIVGAQWGDEGKGIVVATYARNADIVVRAQGGDNAGHTLYNNDGEKIVVNILPSGAVHEHVTNVVGHGCVVNLETLASNSKGIDGIDKRLLVSDAAHIIMPYHIAIDRAREKKAGKRSIGTTNRGIGPAYGDKIARIGIRAGMLRDRERLECNLEVAVEKANGELERLGSEERFAAAEIIGAQGHLFDRFEACLADVPAYLHEQSEAGKRIIFEGAQAAMLDIDQGTYPGVTSSNTSTAGLSTGSGFPASKMNTRLGIAKAYTTRVGAGGFPTQGMAWEDLTGDLYDNIPNEATEALAEGDTSHPLYDLAASIKIRSKGAEYGATTGRPRATGWLDLAVLRYAARVSDLTHLAITKLDVLAGIKKLKVGVGYKNETTGEEIDTFPSDPARLNGFEPTYKEFDGWNECSGIKEWDELPQNARNYIIFIEKEVGVPVALIKTGPEQNDYIERFELEKFELEV